MSADLSISRDVKRRGFIRLATAAAVTGIAILCLLGEMPSHPMSPSVVTRTRLLTVFPQGWAFFTRDAQEPQRRVYRREGDRWLQVDERNGSTRFLLGFRREGRLHQLEISHIAKKIPAPQWVECKTNLATCADSAVRVPVRVENTFAQHHFCGTILFEDHVPVPWAWSRVAARTYMPGRVVVANSDCVTAKTTVAKGGL
jgi:antimicrobial peptide system SdpA family protein